MRRVTPEAERLAQVPLFAACSPAQLRLLASNVTEHRFTAGAVLMQEGRRGHEFFVLLDGEVEVTVDGYEVATIRAGGFVGEMALLDEPSRSATVTARTDVHVLVCTQQEFAACLDIAPHVARELLSGVSERLRRTTGTLAGGVRGSAPT